MPTSKGLGAAVRAGNAIGCSAVQVFTSSPQQWRAKPVTDEMVADFRTACRETGIETVVSHDSYLINLCTPDPEMRAKSVAGLTAEIERCHRYGIRWVVSHMGAHMGQGEECGIREIARATAAILENTPDDVTLCMETTAGQGSCMNCRFEQLAGILEACQGNPRLAVCLDTCHIFAAGYDIRTDEAYDRTFEEFDRTVGLGRLAVIHCNDSKKPLGSRVDRHEHIGEGEIGIRAFQRLTTDERFTTVPIILETPEAPEAHERNLATLKEASQGRTSATAP